MPAGRPRLSDAHHALAGTRPTRAKVETESAIVSGRPRAPKHLSEEALTYWRDAMRLMRKRGALTPGDAPSLELFALVKEQMMQASRDVAKRGQIITETKPTKSGSTYEVETLNPSVRIFNECSRQMLMLAKSLGLSPDSREKVKPPKAKAKDEPPKKGSVAELLLMTSRRAIPKREEQEDEQEEEEETDEQSTTE